LKKQAVKMPHREIFHKRFLQKILRALFAARTRELIPAAV
jgi:hypothetical protein